MNYFSKFKEIALSPSSFFAKTRDIGDAVYYVIISFFISLFFGLLTLGLTVLVMSFTKGLSVMETGIGAMIGGAALMIMLPIIIGFFMVADAVLMKLTSLLVVDMKFESIAKAVGYTGGLWMILIAFFSMFLEPMIAIPLVGDIIAFGAKFLFFCVYAYAFVLKIIALKTMVKCEYWKVIIVALVPVLMYGMAIGLLFVLGVIFALTSSPGF